MRDRDPYPDDMAASDPPEAASGEAVTPRGGFMARPGLKAPPRHAVVVRMGDAPISEHIPVARQSVPPPAPIEPAPPSSSDDKVTLRAIPAPSAAPSPPPVESLPPPSDMPVVASIRAPQPARPSSKRSPRASLTIALASAAGIVLGLASVAMTRLSGDQQSAAATQPATNQAAPEAALQPAVEAPGEASLPAAPPSSLTPAVSAAAPPSASPAPRRAPSGERRSIF